MTKDYLKLITEVLEEEIQGHQRSKITGLYSLVNGSTLITSIVYGLARKIAANDPNFDKDKFLKEWEDKHDRD